MIEDAAVFSTLAQCFGPVDEQTWNELTAPAAWDRFLDGTRSLLQDDRLLGQPATFPTVLVGRQPLQEFLSSRALSALFNPPTYEAKRTFAAQHFTGGLPTSAMPVESLYRPEHPAEGVPAGGEYLGDAARYLGQLVAALGLEVPAQFADCPDHLALELDLMAVMLRSSMRGEAEVFLAERFGWLTEFRARLMELGPDADFYVGLIDVVVGIRAQQEYCCERAEFEYATDSVA